ncbi:hypothetical protein EDB83DRAFT_2325460 [Lactarius deliciosus]|nr:hypothetical protein EDB83DRAFT_2325460 [Lactarius deliciosus]
MWQGLGVLCAVSGWRGGRWWLDLACCVEAAWRVGGVGGSGVLRAVLGRRGGRGVACYVGVAVAVVGCREPCRGGMLAWGRVKLTRVLEAVVMACNVQGEREKKKKKKEAHILCIWTEAKLVGHVLHVGAACWGGDEWRWPRWLACTRGRQWPAMLKASSSSAMSSILRSGDGPCGITAWW